MPPVPENAALFLDFDGTLVPFAETPNGVVVPDELVPLLRRICEKLDGAFAFVTGRSISNLDELIGTDIFDTIGVHGAEWRIGSTPVEVVEGAPFDAEREVVQAFADAHDGIVLQEKSAGFTLHFRQVPQLRDASRIEMERAFASREDFELMSGAMMWEARRKGVHKGEGIERLMAVSPFVGRVPLFVGDDVTDEDAHRTINVMNGHSVKVGESETDAKHRLPDIQSVYSYLERLAQ